MCVVKPPFFGSVKEAETYVDGVAVCQEHAKELLRRKGIGS